MMRKLWVLLKDMPSTNVRIFCTILIFFGTSVRYQISGVTIAWLGVSFDAWQPSWEWCVLLLGAMGVDAAQMIGKRLTYIPDTMPKDTEDKQRGSPPDDNAVG